MVLISTVRDGQEDFEQLYRTLQMCDVALTKEGDHEKERCAGQEKLQKLAGTLARAPIYVYPPGSYIVNTGRSLRQRPWRSFAHIRQQGCISGAFRKQGDE